MPTEKKRINLTLPPETYETIRRVKCEYGFMHDTVAVNYLIALGIAKLKGTPSEM